MVAAATEALWVREQHAPVGVREHHAPVGRSQCTYRCVVLPDADAPT